MNNNKQLVLELLTQKSKELVNFKFIKSYVNSIFNWAVKLEFIDSNRILNTISKIKSLKKIKLEESKNDEDKYLSEDELRDWLDAFKFDYEDGKIGLKEYTLFFTTFILSNRKAETYALRWENIDLKNSLIRIAHSLDKYGNIKSTKGNKKTVFSIPDELTNLLKKWKSMQNEKLDRFNLIQNDEQLVFTYIDTQGNINNHLHPDYLNYRMLAVRKRHPNLVHCTPHKLRHTGASLSKNLVYK
ncbi:site-specific integrase [Helcococcus bovis]|uniref:site-specific integrase n=1 Tax=Helcococcus bovis TaxID=3153252 RepID=UPI0038BB1793